MTDIDRRKFLVLSFLSAMTGTLAGCSAYSADWTVEDILEFIRQRLEAAGDEGDEDEGPVTLSLTYPAGRSPSVFTMGWVFGARALINAGTDDEEDVSDQVKWGGSGTFNPDVGSLSHPVFNSPGANTITLSIQAGGKVHEKTFNVNAVAPFAYAYQTWLARCPADSHGCPACPHPTIGPIISGSPNVLINGHPAARVGDTGIHAACCGPNTFTITTGDSNVLINGRAAALIGKSVTQHCGGTGKLVGAE